MPCKAPVLAVDGCLGLVVEFHPALLGLVPTQSWAGEPGPAGGGFGCGASEPEDRLDDLCRPVGKSAARGKVRSLAAWAQLWIACSKKHVRITSDCLQVSESNNALGTILQSLGSKMESLRNGAERLMKPTDEGLPRDDDAAALVYGMRRASSSLAADW